MDEYKNTYIKNLLGKSKFKRNNKEAEMIEKLLENLSYFQNLSKKHPKHYKTMLSNLVSKFKFREFKKGKKIWDYNQKADSYFIVIQGSVNLYKSPIIGKLAVLNNKIEEIKKNDYSNINNNNIVVPENTCHTSLIKILEQEILKQSYYIDMNKDKNSNIENNKTNENKLNNNYIEKTNKKNKNNDLNKNDKNNDDNDSNFKIINFIKEKDNETENTNTNTENIPVRNNFRRRSIRKKKTIRESKATKFSLTISSLLKSEKVSEVLNEGQAFGEDCIINNVTFHTDKAEAKTNCILAELSKIDYESIIGKLNSMEKANMIHFLKGLNLFVDKYKFIEKLQKKITIAYYKKGEIIYNQNDEFRGFFFIKSGIISLSFIVNKEINNGMDREILIGKKINERFTYERMYEITGNYIEENLYKLVNLSDGEILGDIEYYKKLKKYLNTAQCITDVELYEISPAFFDKITNENNSKKFYDNIILKCEIFQKRINEIFQIKEKHNKEKNKFARSYFKNHKNEKNDYKIDRNCKYYMKNGKMTVSYNSDPYLDLKVKLNKNTFNPNIKVIYQYNSKSRKECISPENNNQLSKTSKYPIIYSSNHSQNNTSEIRCNLKTDNNSKINENNDKTITTNYIGVSNIDEVKKENKSIFLSGNKSINCFSEKKKSSNNFKIKRKIDCNFEKDSINFDKYSLTSRKSNNRTLKLFDSNNSKKLKIYELFGINKKFYIDTNMNKVVKNRQQLFIHLK